MEKKKRNYTQSKYDYIHKYTQENYITFGTKLKIEEYEELKLLLEQKGMTNSDFIKWAIEKLRSM